MDKKANRGKLIIIACFVSVLIIIASIGAVLNFEDVNEDEVTSGRLSGRVYDAETGVGLYYEVCVMLEGVEDADYPANYTWPDDPEKRGCYDFPGLEPGTYRLHLSRSWQRFYLNGDPNERYDLDGGWTFPPAVPITIKAGDHLVIDFPLELYASMDYTCEIENRPLHGIHGRVFGIYIMGDPSWLGDNSNLIGKTMRISCTWVNTLTTRSDMTIVIPEFSSSSVEYYEVGGQREVLDFILTQEYFDYLTTEQDDHWRVEIDSYPTPDTADIPITITWEVL